ncbi:MULTISPECIES: glycosyltransferase family 4 protein [unclassified Flavobacterium]|jgi:glycosyltransferase involved in cell wall biosynthesis|uniref:glycosyltransferase family 4 protein n=1 Tax=unclassified Flavobacterium TaxID=196869 RepID=UPI0025B9B0A3|nr:MULTISPECIES: glycosyltransferase family 4 protein [unclassified Flavobacterium]
MPKRKILFLGETYRADAITWMNGLKEFGDFEIITWELKKPNTTFFNRVLRIFEFSTALFQVRKIIRLHHPDMVIAERTTSYGFLAALSGTKPVVIAQQGRTDLWPENSFLLPLKKIMQHYAFQKADLIHAWGPVMTVSMKATNVDMNKVLVMPKGIDLVKFENKNTANPSKINAIVSRSLTQEYRHDVILKAFSIINQEGIDFELTIVGDGKQLPMLKKLATKLEIENKVNFTGRIANIKLPELLQQSNFYISIPITEGVSTSLFEAMASNCYPVVTNIAGNKSWIKHRENGQLITIDDSRMLAEELLWAFENGEHRNAALLKNRKFVEEYADYNTNMKIIADKYHELINTTRPN